MLINEEIKEHLKAAEFAVLPVKIDLGAGEEVVILVKSTADVLAGVKEAKATVRIGWAVLPTAKGPVACLCLNAEAKGVGGFLGEAYLDPTDDEDYALMQRVAGQKRLKAAMFDEELQLVWAADVVYDDLERLCAEQAADRGDELAERALLYELQLDFEEACRFFRAEMPLEKLSELALGKEGGNG